MAPAVGQDIEALCGRCGQVWHVVMAMMGDRIAKVVCKRCGGHHRYRREGDSEEAAAEKAKPMSRSSMAGRSIRRAQPVARRSGATRSDRPPSSSGPDSE